MNFPCFNIVIKVRTIINSESPESGVCTFKRSRLRTFVPISTLPYRRDRAQAVRGLVDDLITPVYKSEEKDYKTSPPYLKQSKLS